MINHPLHWRHRHTEGKIKRKRVIGKYCMRAALCSLTLLMLSLKLVLAQKPPQLTIRRLDGTSISIAEAEDFARKTLATTQVTGAQIVVINEGRVVWSAAFGLRKHQPKTPMLPDTTTWAASITKAVFATYVMQLVERRELSLDLPVADQLPQPLNAYKAYGEIASEVVNDPRWHEVTPRMLLAHTGGLLNFVALEPDKKMHLHFKPGTQFCYSNEGINLIQFLVEQKLGQPLERLMQDAIFSPLHMSRTGLIFRTDFAANIADRYGAKEQFLSETRRLSARAAGSMTTSADDLGHFACALLNGKLLKPATRKAMLSPFIQIRTRSQFPFRPDAPEGKEGQAVGLAYGMGWGLLTKTRFGPAFFKEGHGEGAQNYLILFEKSKSGMILLTNSDNGELAFRPLLEKILGDTVTPWEWEGYTPDLILENRKFQ